MNFLSVCKIILSELSKKQKRELKQRHAVKRSDVPMIDKDISRYQISVITDSETCDKCRILDGCVVNVGDYRRHASILPLHEGCRCIWAGIYKEETEKPKITGFPESIELI